MGQSGSKISCVGIKCSKSTENSVENNVANSAEGRVPQKRRKGDRMEHKFTTENFEQEVLKSDIPVLVDFFADWCGPCKMMAPVVEKMAEEFEGRIKVGKLNTDENMQIAQQYRIASIPTFMVFKEGKVSESWLGAMSAADLQSKLEQVLV